MKVKDLWLLSILDEMRGENLNRGIDSEFYDWTGAKDIEWLYDYAEIIVIDFYHNIDIYEFEIENKQYYFPISSKYLSFTDFEADKKFIENAIKEMKEN